jgi:hypothetical protein
LYSGWSGISGVNSFRSEAGWWTTEKWIDLYPLSVDDYGTRRSRYDENSEDPSSAVTLAAVVAVLELVELEMSLFVNICDSFR